jgi:hypothetical protein
MAATVTASAEAYGKAQNDPGRTLSEYVKMVLGGAAGCRRPAVPPGEEGCRQGSGRTHQHVEQGVVLALDHVACGHGVESPFGHLPEGADGDAEARKKHHVKDVMAFADRTPSTIVANQKVMANRVAACRMRSNRQEAA